MTVNACVSTIDRSDAATLLWCDLLNQLAWETEQLLGNAIESLQSLYADGQPPARPVRELRRKLEQARQVGMAGRQIARLAERQGPTAPAAEVPLAEEIAAAMELRAAEFRARGIRLLRHLPAITVAAEPSLVALFARALVAWAITHADHANAELELRLDRPESADAPAMLSCRLRHRADVPGPTRFAGPANWGAQWQLVRHAAQALGWDMRCGDGGPFSWLRFSFPWVSGQRLPTMEAIELCPQAASGTCRVLLVSPEAGLRDAVSRALRRMDVELDFADSAQEAERYCAHAVPGAVLLDGVACGEEGAQWWERMRAAGREPVVIEIAPGDEFDVDVPAPGRVGRVGRRALAGGLPTALMLSLAGRTETVYASA